MKLTIAVQSKDGWHIRDLSRACESNEVDVNVIQITSKKDYNTQTKHLGDVVLWRSAFLDHSVGRPAFGLHLNSKILVNDAVFVNPMTAQKFYQQNKLLTTPTTKKYAIPTFHVKTGSTPRETIERLDLKLPLIMKPNQGAMGKGVVLLKDIKDNNLDAQQHEDMVLQPFIENDGDWRVIILGGAPLGAIKRVAVSGSILNNVSQGASATIESDPGVLSVIYGAAIKAASAMGLRFTGVDIIKDKHTGQYYVLETNSAPQWDGEQGFASITGVDVADRLVKYCLSLYKRSKMKSPINLVENYYKENISLFPTEAFHFASRLWLWSRDEWSREYLDSAKELYIGSNPDKIREKVASICSREISLSPENSRRPYRIKYFEHYPELKILIPLLFKVIFCQTIYNLDIRPYVREKISDKEFIDTFNRLIKDKDAIRILSTHAINYFYLLRYYFRDNLSVSSSILVDPDELLELAGTYTEQVLSGEVTSSDARKLEVYLFTHAILGGSEFYYRKALGSKYKEMCRVVESIIEKDYFDMSLDNKFEFLVCCKIVGYKTRLKRMIHSEAIGSLSWSGNFLVDTANTNEDKKRGHSIRVSEHRNVLYIMSKTQFVPIKQRAKPVNNSKPKTEIQNIQIGRLARVELPEFGVRLVARVDSGATKCSIAVSNLVEKDGQLSFCIGRPKDPFYTGDIISTSEFQITTVKTTTKAEDARYEILVMLRIKGTEQKVWCTLSDRAHMLYPMLIGRSALTFKFVVNTAKQFG